MIFKIIFISVFILLFVYSILRPFHSIISRLFLMIGSILGVFSLIGVSYAQNVADFLGIGRAADLYLYLSLVTIFLFVTFTINRFDSFNRKISKLTKELAISRKSLKELGKEK